MKASNIMYAVRNRPRPNGLNLALICLYAISRNNVSQECSLMSEKGTFLEVTKHLFTFKNRHELSKMMLMLLLILGVNQNIIEDHQHILI